MPQQSIQPPLNINDFPTDQLATFVSQANDAYRLGSPQLSDDDYDFYVEELRKRNPEHQAVSSVESEPDFGAGKVPHASPMLSTDKAYTTDDIQRFIARIHAAAEQIDVDPYNLEFRVTPKLDGMAARLYGSVLASRGDGKTGNNISHLIDAGLVIPETPSTHTGEIVVDLEYFNTHLAAEFANARNFVAGLASSQEISKPGVEALAAGAVRLEVFDALPHATIRGGSLAVETLISLCEQVETECSYQTDGAVIEVVDRTIRKALGSTSHHHRWQIARKKLGDEAIAKVTGVTWQVGRTGKLTPVVNIEPTVLSGATISNVTAHHAGHVKGHGIGVGAEIRIIRSGEVIPKIVGIESPADRVEIPDACPVCASPVHWRGESEDFLVCTNVSSCNGQLARRLEHWFTILGNVDGFGPSTVDALIDGGFLTVASVYAMAASDFERLGFGPKQSENLVAELQRSRETLVEDYKWLAALGIPHLGRGDSRKLLEVIHLTELGSVTAEEISLIHGFASLTATSIASDLNTRWAEIEHLLGLGFTLQHRQDVAAAANNSSSGISGMTIVFTGKLSQSRDDMRKEAESYGARTGSSVTGSTDLLVAGDNVGQTKIDAAAAKGVRVVSEAAYYEMVG